jgi:hypothetical protein
MDATRNNQEWPERAYSWKVSACAPRPKGSVSGGKPSVTDGPFAETKELIAGFTLIQVKSREEAIEWARRWPPIDADAEIEIRQLFEPEDFEAR